MSYQNGTRWIRTSTRLALYIRSNFFCDYCNKNLRKASPRHITLDHVVPRSLGGDNSPENLVTACLSCNTRKWTMRWTQFVTDEGQRIHVRKIIRQKLNRKLANRLLKDKKKSRK